MVSHPECLTGDERVFTYCFSILTKTSLSLIIAEVSGVGTSVMLSPVLPRDRGPKFSILDLLREKTSSTYVSVCLIFCVT